MTQQQNPPSLTLIKHVPPPMPPAKVEHLKTKQQLDEEHKQRTSLAVRAAMADRLRSYADRMENGELSGFAITAVETATGNPVTEWRARCKAPDIGHAISCLFNRFYKVHTTK